MKLNHRNAHMSSIVIQYSFLHHNTDSYITWWLYIYTYVLILSISVRCIYPQNRRGEPIINPTGKYIVCLNLNGCKRRVSAMRSNLPHGWNKDEHFKYVIVTTLCTKIDIMKFSEICNNVSDGTHLYRRCAILINILSKINKLFFQSVFENMKNF